MLDFPLCPLQLKINVAVRERNCQKIGSERVNKVIVIIVNLCVFRTDLIKNVEMYIKLFCVI